jgi:hypothetical protein
MPFRVSRRRPAVWRRKGFYSTMRFRASMTGIWSLGHGRWTPLVLFFPTIDGRSRVVPFPGFERGLGSFCIERTISLGPRIHGSGLGGTVSRKSVHSSRMIDKLWLILFDVECCKWWTTKWLGESGGHGFRGCRDTKSMGLCDKIRGERSG